MSYFFLIGRLTKDSAFKTEVMSTQDIFIVHPETEEQAQALKAFVKALKINFEITSHEKSYKEDFLAKVKQGELDLKEGKGVSMSLEELENLYK